MKILQINVFRGPNYWSNYRKKLISMKLDIGGYEELPTNRIDGFTERLTSLIPSLYTHRCSVGKEGGFVLRMKEGTWLGHVIEHVALEMQSLAGMECGFGRTRSDGEQGIYNVVFSYQIENAGLYAARAAVRLVKSIAEGKPCSPEHDIQKLKSILYDEGFGPSTLSIVTEAENRGIPVTRLSRDSLVMLGQGKKQKTIRATIAGTTSNLAVDIAGDKEETKRVLDDNYIPVPAGTTVDCLEELDEAIAKLGYPLVLKPLNGNHGRGITTNVQTREQALNALIHAKQISDEVIIEQHINGEDYRFLVINFKLAAVSKRTPAMVTGDGLSTIRQLIDQINSDPNRGDGHEKVLTKIKIDKNTRSILKENRFTLDAVLAKGKTLKLKDTANISSGGTAANVTSLVHPHNIFLAERVARLVGLNICGIDIMAKDVTQPINDENGAVLEVNAAPGFRMHQYPSEGEPINVAAPVLDMLFGNQSSRIPLVAITGTNGKTTTTRLLAHLAKCAGFVPGYTTTEGIYINDIMITGGDCSGPGSAAVVLRDPLVDFAVLETARGGILRSGLGFDHCNVSIVTNVSADHLGLNGINTINELARVKSVVPKSTFDDGYAVLNADDDLVYEMREELSCHIALFSTDPKSPRISAHCEDNGLAAVAEQGQFVLYKGIERTVVLDIEAVPLTLKGKSDAMIQNTLAALLGAFVSDIPMETIRSGLQSFVLSSEMAPGRMNEFQFRNFRLIIDYAHNVGGFLELKNYLSKEQASIKTGIIGATGDRRDEDIELLGRYGAQMFNQLIIRHDKDSRGRSNIEITRLLMQGIRKINPHLPVTVISDEAEAIRYAVEHAQQDALIFVCSDEIMPSLALIRELQEKENKILVDDES
jgi:cyanophycin synthetase